MERLTARINPNCVEFTTKDYGKIADSLCRYEDTGLDPEDVNQYARNVKEIGMECTKRYDKIVWLQTENASLRSQLAEVTAERDAAVALIASLVDLCSVPQADQSKVFRRLVFGAGDYMGSGYAFIDAFYRIWDEFEENATEPLYRSIRAALDGLRKGPDNANG